MSHTPIPKKWHVHIVDLEPRMGTKPGKQRPALAIQPDEFGCNGLKSTVIIPVTTQLSKGNAWPLRIRIPAGTCQLKSESELLIDQILAWDNSLIKEDLGLIPWEIRQKVREALKEFLDLDNPD